MTSPVFFDLVVRELRRPEWRGEAADRPSAALFALRFPDGLALGRDRLIHGPNILRDGYKFEGDATPVV
jgi:hypothetical protein